MWTRQAAAAGVAWTAVDTRRVQGMSAPEWSTDLAAHCGGGRSPAAVERAVVDAMVDALRTGLMEPFPGAADMVRETAERVPVALATSAPRRLVDAVLDRHGLAPAFGATVSSAEVARGKPDPAVYREAARRLDVDPRACVGVEDSSNGLRAAHAAGMTVLALPNPTYPPEPDALALAARVADGVPAARRALDALLTATEVA